MLLLNDQVILQIPPQFHQFWLQRDRLTGRDLVPRAPTDIKSLKPIPLAGFVMHYPSYGGYTPQNYERDFDEDRIEVVTIAPASLDEMKPGAPGHYAPNSLERVLKAERLRSTDFVALHGMQCYTNSGDQQHLTCYGKRESKVDEFLLLNANLPPYPQWVRYPLMRTVYFSPRYGGLEIAWRAHVKHFEHWCEIDAAVWKKIDAWNVAPNHLAR